VTLGDDGSATVESRGQHYEVSADGACICPDAQHRGITCKHALAVQIHSLASASLRLGGDHRYVPTPAADEPRVQGWQPTPKTSARWDVHEAPASACFKCRVGGVELLYTLRGVDDAELVRRITATLPTLHDVMDAYDAHTAARDTATSAPQPPLAVTVPAAPVTPTQPDLQTLVQQAVATALAQAPACPSANAAPSAPAPDDQQTGFCSLHQTAMTLHTDPASGDTWYRHYCDETQRYCKGARPARRHGHRR
jgi:hypothetical protein